MGLVGCLSVFGGVAWYITGIIFRWRHYGKVCSGDYWDMSSGEPNVYLVNTGEWMVYYYVVTWIILGITCLGWCGFFAVRFLGIL